MVLLKVVRFPLTRMVIGVALIGLFGFGASRLNAVLSAAPGLGDGTAHDLVSAGLAIVAVVLAYAVLVRGVEGRPVSELSLGRAVPELVGGLLVGAALISVVIAALFALGHYRVVAVGSPTLLIAPFIGAAATGFAEEIAVRGVIYRIVEEWLGTWIALLFSAALFGALHLGNPNATLMGAATIALTAGVLLAAVYTLTRRLWLAIGIHAGWNFTLGGFYGGAVSGGHGEGLLQSEFSGPDLLTGGAFGVEASAVTLAAGFLLALYYLGRARAKGNFIAPPWARRGA